MLRFPLPLVLVFLTLSVRESSQSEFIGWYEDQISFQLYKCDPLSYNQRFTFHPADGSLSLALLGYEGLCVSADAPNATASANVKLNPPDGLTLQMKPCNASDPALLQSFAFQSGANMTQVLASPGGNGASCSYADDCAVSGVECCQCLNAIGASSSSGTEVALYPCSLSTAPNEQFRYEAETGQILGLQSGLCVDSGSGWRFTPMQVRAFGAAWGVCNVVHTLHLVV